MNAPPCALIKLSTGNRCRVMFERKGTNIVADLRWIVTPDPEELSFVENWVCGVLTGIMGVGPDSIASTHCGTDAARAEAIKSRFLRADEN